MPDDDPSVRIFAAFRLAEAYRAADDLEAASAAFAKTAELGRAAGHDYVALEAMGSQARLQLARGRLREAGDILQRVLRSAAARENGAALPATGELHVVMGELLYEWDDLDSAEDRLTEGMELAERMGKFDTLVDGYVSLSRVERARGDTDGALEAAREAERLSRSSGVGQLIVEAETWKTRLQLARGDLAAAAFWQEQASGVSGIPPSAQETERTTLVRRPKRPAERAMR